MLAKDVDVLARAAIKTELFVEFLDFLQFSLITYYFDIDLYYQMVLIGILITQMMEIEIVMFIRIRSI